MRKSVFIFFLVVLCGLSGFAQINKSSDPTALHKAQDYLTEVIVHDIFHPRFRAAFTCTRILLHMKPW